MEKKQLNLNQRLLSVRRFTSTIASESDNTDIYNSSAQLPYLAYKSEMSSGPVRNAGAVPFQWEKTPGKPKDISVIDSDDGDESFQDARDTLSRTESFFMRSSMSSDDCEVQVRPIGGFSSDEQAREFMIDRFLPAAKAMICETPQCAPKKAGFGQGQQKQIWKIRRSEKSYPVNQHKPKSVRFREGGRMENKEEYARPSYQRGCGESLVCESPTVEKTLYVDFIHRTRFEIDHRGDDFEALKRDSDIYENLSVDSLLENNQELCDVNAKIALEAKFSQTTNIGIQGSDLDQDLITISNPKMVQCKKIDDDDDDDDNLSKDSDFDIKRRPAAKLIDREQTLEYDRKIDLERQCGLTLGHQELTGATSFFEIPLVLPSLKAPSESWLTRTLPAISTKNTCSKPKPCCKYLFKTASLYPKSSNGVMQFHEELVKPIAKD